MYTSVGNESAQNQHTHLNASRPGQNPAPRTVVITGVGVISAIGNDYTGFTESLRNGTSGTVSMPDWSQYKVKSQVAAPLNVSDEKINSAGIPKKLRNAMSRSALYCGVAANDAIKDAHWCEQTLGDERTACLVSSGVADVGAIHRSAEKYYSGNIRRGEPYTVLKAMSSTASALLSNQFGITGRSYSISSACATGTHNIGHAFELIQSGIIDRAVCGGCEDVNELITGSF